MIEKPELPNGWGWWSSIRGSGYYTHWFGTEYRQGGDLVGKHGSTGGFDGEVYWDEGGDHHVAIYPIEDASGDDPIVSEYAAKRGSFDTEKEAIEAVPGLIQELKMSDYEPEQVRHFFNDPATVDGILAKDISIEAKGVLVAEVYNVEYRFTPSHIKPTYDEDEGEWVYPESKPTFREAFDLAMTWDVSHLNHIYGHGDYKGVPFDACWDLDEIRIDC